MPERPTLLHRMALVSFLLFRKNLGKLREFFGQIVYRPPWQKIACTPMEKEDDRSFCICEKKALINFGLLREGPGNDDTRRCIRNTGVKR